MSTSAVLRPVRSDEAGSIWDVLSDATDTVGMGSLPRSAAAAEHLCDASARLTTALATGTYVAHPGSTDRILLVLEDNDRVVGITGCSFKTEIPNLGVRIETGEDGAGLVMRAVAQPWTRTELDSSYLAAPARGQGLGTLLSRGRFLLLHLLSSQIPTTIVSHIRGMFDTTGAAPFWHLFGARIVPGWSTSVEAEAALAADPGELERLAGSSIRLTAPVLECLGRVNDDSLPAFRALASEGLRPTELFDPVDGGPTVTADLDATHSGRQRRHGRVAHGPTETDALVSTVTRDGFRATRCPIGDADSETVALDNAAMAALGVDDGLVVASPLAEAT